MNRLPLQKNCRQLNSPLWSPLRKESHPMSLFLQNRSPEISREGRMLLKRAKEV
jgi:hypothetical protein